MYRVGKKTPVWQNIVTGEVVCAPTIQEALGVSWLFPVSDNWKQVSELPLEQRVVIDNGAVLPVNNFTLKIAAEAECAGNLRIKVYGRERSVNIAYCDPTRVILKN